jgi:hypothetical protein
MSHSSAVLGHEPKQPRRVALPAGGSHPAGPSAPREADVGCPMCGNLEPWGNSSWCPQCGFYPRLGISLGPALKTASESTPAAKSTREIWQRAPVWVKVLCAGMLGIFVASVAARLALPEKGLARTLTALLQLATGLGVLATMHTAAFFKAAMTNHRFGFIDALLHPVETWKPTNFPRPPAGCGWAPGV